MLDCSAAGILIPSFINDKDDLETQYMSDTIVLCPCAENERLPLHPDYPADIFTSCLTTPIPMALLWFVRQNRELELDPEQVEIIPGTLTDRKTPLGELNWIFITVTDSIAWNVLPKTMFLRLFRKDIMVASRFRNFLLADRILRNLGCTPQSYPPLPSGTDSHPLWRAWDLAVETMLFQLKEAGVLVRRQLSDPDAIVGDEPASPPPETTVSVSSPFFAEQLTAFELWLDFCKIHRQRRSPEQLPVVLQVVLSPAHRVRALKLLRRFLALGPWAVNMSLGLGVFPYVLKLLASEEYRSYLVSIWAAILSVDPSKRTVLLRDGVYKHFVSHLTWGLNSTSVDVVEAAQERTTAAFILAACSHEFPGGQAQCVQLNLHRTCCALLSSYEQGEHLRDRQAELHLPAHFRLWLCMCLACIVKGNLPMQTEAYVAEVDERLKHRRNDPDPDVRAASCYALGCLIGSRLPVRTLSQQDLSASKPVSFLPSGQSPGFLPNSFGASTGMVLPPVAPPASTPLPLQGQLQPSLGQAGLQQMHQSQQLDPRATGQQVFGVGQPFGQPTEASFWSQTQMLQGQPGQYLMQPPAGTPTGHGFFLGGSSMMSQQGQQAGFLNSSLQRQTPPPQEVPNPALFEDRDRVNQDLSSVEHLLEAACDGSVVVRHEAVVAIGCAVSKYVDVFVAIEEESDPTIPNDRQKEGINHLLSRGLRQKDLNRFKFIWQAIRLISRGDSFPPISRAASDTIKVVRQTAQRRRDEAEMHSSLARDPDTDPSKPPSRVVILRDKEEMTTFPKSEFYEWKKGVFDPCFSGDDSPDDALDPLSPEGAAKSYQDRRNALARERSTTRGSRFACLAPQEIESTRRRAELFEEDEAAMAAEEEIFRKRRELELRGKHLLKNSAVRMTSLIEFHPFENFLMACGDSDAITLWNTETGNKAVSFRNGNHSNSRVTSSRWINEETSSLFICGSGDGTVKIYGDILENAGGSSGRMPKLVSSFQATPMRTIDDGSGLVMEWQPYCGTLITGGNTQYLRCWDMEAEKVAHEFEIGDGAHITTLTTAWDPDGIRVGEAVSGIGPTIVVAGQTDGTVKVFDIRTRAATNDSAKHVKSYSEHNSWVVTTSFTGYGGHHEVMSGTIEGEIKAWDLRRGSSIRSINLQRSDMTCLSIHPRIPMVAAGTEQFVKIASANGDTMQILRYFNRRSSKNPVGPVSCLGFHPYKPVMAAGGTEGIIGLYATKEELAHH